MNKRFEALDAFRGLCALSVVVFHMNLIGSVTELAFFRGSSIFVEFFFVLSGFVLAHSYGFKSNLNFFIFMKSRFFRLYPLHFFMFIVFIVLEFGKLFAYKFGGFIFNDEPFTASSDINEIIPNLLLIHAWTPFTDHLTFNYPSWSISIEFYMYALLFISIAVFKSNRVISWFLLSLLAFFLIYSDSEILVSQVLRGLSCFFGGAVTYVVYKRNSHFRPPYVFGSVVEFSMLISIILIVQSSFSYIMIIAPALFFLTIFFFAFESGFFSRLLKMKSFQYVGKLSYSIYMTHAAMLFCLISAAVVLQKVTGIEMAPNPEGVRTLDFGSVIVNNLVVLAILLFVIYISSFTYKYVELYGQKLNKK